MGDEKKSQEQAKSQVIVAYTTTLHFKPGRQPVDMYKKKGATARGLRMQSRSQKMFMILVDFSL